MAEAELLALAQAVGLLVDWEDAGGRPQRVAPDSLRAILAAMDLPCGSPRQAVESLEDFRRARQAALSRFLTADAGAPVLLPFPVRDTRARLRLETGEERELQLARTRQGVSLPAVAEPGYHRLELDGGEVELAVAPARAVQVEDLAPGRRLWGAAVQVYALRGERPSGFGDFGALAGFASAAARAGADAVAISPVHALFAADARRFSPYAPSTRLFLNGLYADPGAMYPEVAAPPEPIGGELIDWSVAAPARLAALARVHAHARLDPEDARWRTFQAFRRDGGADLENHARFEALHAHFLSASGAAGWREWPAAFRDVGAPAVEEFARTHGEAVELHAFLQWLAEAGLARAQAAARDGGMAVGLIADLAVGMDAGGSHAWSRPDDLLRGLSVGAPPDLFQPKGQDWGVAAFSPLALQRSGYAGFLATLRAAMRHAGGVRIDHAMGLRRLWLTPSGAGPASGAYLLYPFEDLLRLIALESHRHRAVVVGEDLGTVPEGFREASEARGMMGMRVLWFERDKAGGFIPPRRWSAEAAALSTTHDLPTLAGWWRGRDLDWAARLGQQADDARRREEREADRARLWKAAVAAGVASGPPPSPRAPDPAVEAGLALVAAARCRLAIAPTEDLLAEAEQPNLPGTVDAHPNWRRRLPMTGEDLFADAAVRRRIDRLKAGRAATSGKGER